MITAITSPAASTIAADTAAAIAAATIPGSASRSRMIPESSAACGSTRPSRPRGGGGSSPARIGAAERAARGAAASAAAARRLARGGRSGAAARARRRRAAAPAVRSPAVGRRRPSRRRWRRCGARRGTRPDGRRRTEQNRARALMRSPQFGQKLVSGTRSPVASVAPYGYHLRPDGGGVRVLIISDMEGVAGICRWEQVSAGKSGYEEGRRLYTEELNATVRGAFAGGATEVVVMDCHGAGGDWSFNSLIPEALDARCEFVVQTRVDRVHRDARERLRRRAVRRPARPSGRRARRALAHGQLDQVAQPALQRHDGRRGRHQRRAVRDLGHAGRARHRRRRRLRRIQRAARPEPPDAGRQARPRPLQRAPPLPRKARELLEAAAKDALADIASAPVYDPGAPCTIEVELATSDDADVYRHRAGVTLTDPRTIEATAPTWWDAWRAVYL